MTYESLTLPKIENSNVHVWSTFEQSLTSRALATLIRVACVCELNFPAFSLSRDFLSKDFPLLKLFLFICLCDVYVFSSDCGLLFCALHFVDICECVCLSVSVTMFALCALSRVALVSYGVWVYL